MLLGVRTRKGTHIQLRLVSFISSGVLAARTGEQSLRKSDTQQRVEHRMANIEKYKARDAAYYTANADRVIARQSAYYEANSEKVKATTAAYRAANPEREKAIAVARYAKHSKDMIAKACAYSAANRGACNHYGARHKARGLGLAPELTSSERDSCVGIYDQCQRLNKIFGAGTFEVDHTKPLALGGLHHPNNLQVVPAKWNREKKSLHSNRWETPYEY